MIVIVWWNLWVVVMVLVVFSILVNCLVRIGLVNGKLKEWRMLRSRRCWYVRFECLGVGCVSVG